MNCPGDPSPQSTANSLKRKQSFEFDPMDRSPKRSALRISIPQHRVESEGSASSLFSVGTAGSPLDPNDDTSPVPDKAHAREDTTLARLFCPPIPGLFFDPSLLLSEEIADSVFRYCLETYFTSPEVNQVMLFGRAPDSLSPSSPQATGQSGIPTPLVALLSTLSDLLQPCLPPNVHSLLFPPVPVRARQAIINLYNPGEGITSHVDLLGRFGDGIVGVSFSSGCVMEFARQRTKPAVDGGKDASSSAAPEAPSEYHLYLPERSILVMTEDARYKWTHGIPRRSRDLVESDTGGTWVDRKVRLSITFRWLLPGAEIVGGVDTGSSSEEI
ncbi:hypothetical protein V5O48_005387 [Marasmius crinis-equi]|uniref:Fe2OG dioxygenase domain-containing protein n=1 Tax=Marasmius crinis-equi TaxID=585013 RepID=A0ABR3FME9_9AGAR